MKLLTYNIRCDFGQDGNNCFVYRKPLLLEKIREAGPDVICFQEVLPHVAVWLRENLTEYYVLGCGRDKDLRDEQMTVAYRKDRYNLISMETFWLSETPYLPASRYPEQSICPRTCTEVLLEEMDTGMLYRVFDVHLDHIGSEARRLGLNQIMKKISDESSFLQAAVIIAGDFNTSPDGEEFAVMKEHPEFTDVSRESGPTFHDYGRAETPDKIDYIWVKGLSTTGLEVWKDCRDGVYLSDHYPVMAELKKAEE